MSMGGEAIGAVVKKLTSRFPLFFFMFFKPLVCWVMGVVGVVGCLLYPLVHVGIDDKPV